MFSDTGAGIHGRIRIAHIHNAQIFPRAFRQAGKIETAGGLFPRHEARRNSMPLGQLGIDFRFNRPRFFPGQVAGNLKSTFDFPELICVEKQRAQPKRRTMTPFSTCSAVCMTGSYALAI